MAWMKKRGETKDGRGRYLIEWRDPAGNHRGKTIVGRDEALAFRRDVEAALVGSTYVDPRAGRVTLGDYVRRWMATRAHLRPKTVSRYGQLLRAHILPALGRTPVNGIASSDVEELIAVMLASGAAPQTARNAVAVLSGILRTAARDGLVPRVATQGVRLPTVRRAEQRYLSPDHVALLAGTEPVAPRYRALVWLSAYGGLRFGELAGLKVGALRLLERKVDVVWQVTEDSNRLVEGAPKWGSSRTVTIPRAVAEELARHLAAFPPGPDGFVFTMPGGGPIQARNWSRRVWRPAVRAAGLGPLKPHDLRHTAVAVAVAAGAHPKAIQEMLGHRSITTTLNTYGHLFPSLHEDLAGRLDAVIRGAAAHNLHTDRDGDVVPMGRAGGQTAR